MSKITEGIKLAMEHWKREDAQIVVLPDGYNGSTMKFYATPIERDGAMVKLMCAEPGKDYLIRWALDVDVIKALAEAPCPTK